MRDWKQAERRIAQILGGQRVPVSGRQRGDTPDIEHPILSVEVKSRKSIPAWMENALEQAEAASRDGKMPAVVLHQDGQKYADALVVLRLSDFAGLLRNVEAGEWRSVKIRPKKAMSGHGGPILTDPKKGKHAGGQGALPKRGKRESVTQRGGVT